VGPIIPGVYLCATRVDQGTDCASMLAHTLVANLVVHITRGTNRASVLEPTWIMAPKLQGTSVNCTKFIALFLWGALSRHLDWSGMVWMNYWVVISNLPTALATNLVPAAALAMGSEFGTLVVLDDYDGSLLSQPAPSRLPLWLCDQRLVH